MEVMTRLICWLYMSIGSGRYYGELLGLEINDDTKATSEVDFAEELFRADSMQRNIIFGKYEQ